MDPREPEPTTVQSPFPGDNPKAAILEQLNRILDSEAFSHSPRSKEFLSYVVEHGLQGHTERLKERSIGISLFHRSPSYVTSDDPIVRVKAGEVRRRLAQYYADGSHALEPHIEIPVGTYIPKFHWKSQPVLPPLAPDPGIVEPEPPVPLLLPPRPWKTKWFAAAVALAGLAAAVLMRVHFHTPSALDLFWEPLSATKKPVLILILFT